MKLLNWGLNLLFVLVLVILFYAVGPWLETRFFPVYSKFTLISARDEMKGVVVRLRFTKFRNCDPQGNSWYLGDGSFGFRPLNVYSTGGPPETPRPLGYQQTSDVMIEGVQAIQLGQIFGQTFSRCHPLWLSATPIYP